MNRTILFVAVSVCLALSLFLAGCGSSKTEAAGDTAPPAAQVEPDMDVTNFKVEHPEQFPIVTASAHTGEEGKRSLEEFRSRPLWRNLQAIEAGHVAVISDEVDKPSPGLIDAIEDLAHQLHPEVFTEKSAARFGRESGSGTAREEMEATACGR